MRLAQGHKAVLLVRLKSATPRSQATESSHLDSSYRMDKSIRNLRVVWQ